MKAINNYFKNLTMPKFTQDMHNVSGAAMLIGQTMISAFFVLVILCLILVVDIQRVSHGIALFEAGEWLAIGGAFVMVMALMTLEFVSHYIEAKYGYHKPAKKHLSWRLMVEWWDYFSGQGDSWKAREKSPALHIRKYAGLLKIAILLLALTGSMADEIATVDGTWLDGLIQIATQSTLLEFVRYTTSLIYTYALVSGAELLTGYVAQRASETLLGSKTDSHDIYHEKVIDGHELSVVNINHDMADWYVDPNEIHVSECPDCGWISDEKTSEMSAMQALRGHKLNCPAKREKGAI